MGQSKQRKNKTDTRSRTLGKESPPNPAADAPSHQEESSRFPIIGIGSSAGGLGALKEFFKNMPESPGMAFIIIQHLDPTHESMMVDLLSKNTEMNVLQIKENMPVRKNHIYMTPPDSYIEIRDNVLHVSKPKERRGMRMPIDVLFRSLAEDRGEDAICVILSGTGTDGVLGLKEIKGNGGMAMVQDPDTAQYDGMPREAFSTGVVDYVLPISEMPDKLVNFVKHYTDNKTSAEIAEAPDTAALAKIFALLRNRTNVDFRVYKKSTIHRRISRRMSLHQIEALDEYLNMLRINPEEAEALNKDLLIGVTSFFRDNESWVEFEKLVIPRLLDSKDADSPIRIWIPGCATGEEVYTMAIVMMQAMERRKDQRSLLIFATDVNKDALEFARAGVYSQGIEQDVPEQCLEHYFTRTGNSYRIKKSIRELIIFSVQNIIYDPPFSKIDIISCRNLLIYIEPDMQQKIIELFHFALNPGGYLFLGTSETLGRQQKLYHTLSKKCRIFQWSGSSLNTVPRIPLLYDRKYTPNAPEEIQKREVPKDLIENVVTTKLLQEYVPSAVVVNQDMEVVYYFGNTDKYLKHPPGSPTTKLFELVREGLATRLRHAIQSAKTEPQTVDNARVKRNGEYEPVRFTIFPMESEYKSDVFHVIAFEENPSAISRPLDKQADSSEDDTLVQQLEYELRATKEDLQSTIEEMEASNEELKTSNEEIMSMNEELQSTNEELETSQEELQSLNEELTAVNNQLQEKLAELEEANNNLNNFVASTDIATLFLDRRFRINRFTPSMKKLLNIIDSDVGRPINDLTYKFCDVDLAADAKLVLESLTPFEKEVTTLDGEILLERVLPYRTEDDRIDGVVIAFFDVTEWRKAEEKMRFHAHLLDEIGDAVIAIDSDGSIVYWNSTAAELYGWEPGEVIGEKIMGINPIKNDGRLARLIMETMETRETRSGEFLVQHRDGSKIWVSIANSPAIDDKGELTAVISVSHDITEQMVARERIAESERIFRSLAETIPDIVVRFDPNLRYRYVNPMITTYIGAKSSEVIGKTNSDIGLPEDAVAALDGALKKVLSSRRSQPLEFNITSNGKRRYFRGEFAPEIGNDNAINSIVGSIRDVTDMQEADIRLRSSEAKYRTLFNNMDSGFLLFQAFGAGEGNTPELKCIEGNHPFEQMFGIPDGGTCGQDMNTLLGRLGGGINQRLLETYRTGESAQTLAYAGDMARHFEIRSFKPQEGCLALIVNDVTERIKSDKKLQLDEGIDFLASIADGIARDLGNMVHESLAHLDMLIENSENLNPLQHMHINEVYKESIDAEKLIKNIRFFSPGLASGKRSIDIHALADEVKKELKKTTGKKIRISLDMPEGVLYVLVSREDLRDALLNLGLNAAQAIKGRKDAGKGDITFRASAETITGSKHGIPDGDYVHIVVEDNGVGMSEETSHKAFKPLYTKNSMIRMYGRGLGMTKVYDTIVRKHGGYVNLESEEGKGTRAHIYLQRADHGKKQ